MTLDHLSLSDEKEYKREKCANDNPRIGSKTVAFMESYS